MFYLITTMMILFLDMMIIVFQGQIMKQTQCNVSTDLTPSDDDVADGDDGDHVHGDCDHCIVVADYHCIVMARIAL